MQAGQASGYEERDARQRQRLRAAAIGAIASDGYDAVSIARVCDLAGCSEVTFRRHYDDLAACLKDSCADALEQTRSAAISGWLSEHGWRARLLSACTSLLSFADANRDAARVVLVESVKAGPPLTDHMRQRVSGFERVLTMAFQLHPEGFPSSRHTPRAVTGGVKRLVRTRLVEAAEPAHPAALAAEIVDWICCYRTPSVERLRNRTLTPSERAGVPEEELRPPSRRRSAAVARSPLFPGDGEEERVLSALAHAMLQQGREVLEDETVARFAGISVERLTEAYGGAEGCMEGVLDAFFGEAAAHVAQAQRGAGAWPDSVRLGVAAFVRSLDVFPRMAQLCLLRLPLLPSLACRGEESICSHLISPLLAGAPAPEVAAGVLPDALTGALCEILPWAMLCGGPKKVKGLVDEICFLILAPYLGPEQAVSSILLSAEADRLERGR